MCSALVICSSKLHSFLSLRTTLCIIFITKEALLGVFMNQSANFSPWNNRYVCITNGIVPHTRVFINMYTHILLFTKGGKVESKKLQYCWLVNKKEDSDFEIRKTSNFAIQLLKKNISRGKIGKQKWHPHVYSHYNVAQGDYRYI